MESYFKQITAFDKSYFEKNKVFIHITAEYPSRIKRREEFTVRSWNPQSKAKVKKPVEEYIGIIRKVEDLSMEISPVDNLNSYACYSILHFLQGEITITPMEEVKE